MSSEEKKLEIAKKRVEEKIQFFQHLITYVISIIILFIINKMTSPSYSWWIWPALGWGIGIASHGSFVFISVNGKMKEKLIRRELDKMD